MSFDTWIAFALFAFVSSATPGPNNTMLLASGVNFGWVRTIPHMLGVSLGFSAMVLVIGLGLGEVFERVPMLYTVLRYAGGAYMLYLAWKILNSGPVGNAAQAGRPMSFIAAAAFQWVNPKAWVMALGAITTFLPANHSMWQLVLLCVVMCIINLPSSGSWAVFGSAMRRFLQEPRFLRIFNAAAALALVLSLYPLLKT
jgi:threonine/homoserine/homoserine lactone efflux protein